MMPAKMAAVVAMSAVALGAVATAADDAAVDAAAADDAADGMGIDAQRRNRMGMTLMLRFSLGSPDDFGGVASLSR